VVEPGRRATTATATAIPAESDDRGGVSVARLYGGATRRIAAYLVDGVLVGVMIFAATLILNVLLGPTLTIDRSTAVPRLVVNETRTAINALSGVAIGGAYFVGSWALLGQTRGERLFGLRVERADAAGILGVRDSVIRWVALGGPIGLLSLVAREVFGGGFALTVAIAAWFLLLWASTVMDGRKRGIHDRLAGSVVIREANRRGLPEADRTGT
jgi:uncharacterized RDD family membrane protein YckC